ncbi:MAG: tRNA epoxyqueuosine(34) reductase QueG [Burkholderiales bacterium]|nr:tRNA epoxyqueuosine(34) reductase QueG [Burkholderiales bacterium]
MNFTTLKIEIRKKALELGFLDLTIAKTIISEDSQQKFQQWIANAYHGEMEYLKNNQDLRFNPAKIKENTLTILSLKHPYLQQDIQYHKSRLQKNDAYISSYTLGRDYHKVVKQNLEKLAKWIQEQIEPLNHDYRVFTDSAPVMEVEISSNSGGGWRGKNTLLIHKNHGSMFFLGEIFTNLPLAVDDKTTEHCGSCTKCMDICPTNAFIGPYVLDARKCISYLTIENKGTIPLEFRQQIGNRIYGCDDCQLFCPWNKFAHLSKNPDFAIRNNLDSATLLELFAWSEEEFKKKMQGSAIYRIGYVSWLRNISVAMGNALYNKDIISALQSKLLQTDNEILQEHFTWAIHEQISKLNRS